MSESGPRRAERLELPDGEGGGARADALPARSDLDPRDQWRLEDIYPADDVWERDFGALQPQTAAAAAYRGQLGSSAAVLLEALRLRERQSQVLERLFAYAHMRSDEDTRRSTYQAMQGRIASLATQIEGNWAYFEPELLALPEATLRGWIEHPPTDASGLEIYRHRLEDLLRTKPHVLSAPEEELLARAGDVARAPDVVFGMLNEADLRFPEVHDEQGRRIELTKGRYIRLLESRKRAVREEAFRTLYAAYGRQRNTLGALLGSAVQRDWFYAQARRYGSCLEMALDGDNIPVSVYTSLIGAVRARLPELHRYLRLRRHVLGVERLHMYDLYVPLVEEPRADIPYPEAVDLVAAGIVPLGEDYVARYRRGTAGGWVDVFENQGKRGGAYSYGVYGVHPFVLMNYQGSFDHVFTLAHEFGHALHSDLTQSAQPYTYANYSIFAAEVASTVNEALLMGDLLRRATDTRERAYLINHHLEGFRTTLIRQVMFAEFELRIHEQVERGESLTADGLSEVYRALNADYYGAEVELDPEIDLEWARIPHFYRAFYVYKYATGFSAAQALAEAVRRGGAVARDRYLEFLRSGSHGYPVDLLRRAGVDMVTPAPVAAALDVFARLVGELEGLIGSGAAPGSAAQKG